MAFYGFNTDEFLDEVKKYPEVWNLHSEDNKVMFKKRKAWANIAKVFIENYDELSRQDKIEIDKKIQGKWRNVRDTYVRALKKNQVKKYVYSKKMSFLSEVYKVKSNLNTDAEIDSSDHDDDHLDESGIVDKTKLVWSKEDGHETAKMSEPRSDLDIEYVSVRSTDSRSFDDDRLFFNSLLPATKEFDMDQKLQFRSEVLNIITKIRKEARNRDVKPEPDFDDFD